MRKQSRGPLSQAPPDAVKIQPKTHLPFRQQAAKYCREANKLDCLVEKHPRVRVPAFPRIRAIEPPAIAARKSLQDLRFRNINIRQAQSIYPPNLKIEMRIRLNHSFYSNPENRTAIVQLVRPLKTLQSQSGPKILSSDYVELIFVFSQQTLNILFHIAHNIARQDDLHEL